ncbi:MAG: XRE family transcriptional regulator [Microbacterium sp.]|uniref:helix-turn-helix domain-containing protein n=1 Tax=unclassified Microbacterium TaxID=2609290 RepID=UPI0009F66825|nr:MULTISPECIES: XRE family transcriptional regulator [unclassified Microbacterium]MAY49819.1 XRE family transcriptional regulator [Microbacterium sp.]HAS32601.1 XRE family transcriptional regulator [Microbacterium sp.]HBR87679.1 XRE family transcriptional regulator [Microbacterium sp.]HBS73748.1 XRE family transcriptional regulator [Microbacterium sp.]
MTSTLPAGTSSVGVDAADGETSGLRLGAHIRRLRKGHGLTLVQVAEATGLSHPFLSQLERGLAQPSLGSLRRIAVALQTSPIELVAAADEPVADLPPVEIQRRDDPRGTTVPDGFASGTARLLAAASRPLHPVEISAAATSPGEAFQHPEDEFVYVVEGTVVLDLDGETRTLSVGDSAYYAGGVAHRWWSADGAPYRLVVVKQGSRRA